jgi:NAD-dependent deacetylase
METSDPGWERAIDAVAAALREAHSVLFITGAGISADSGLPTYRGIGGLYDREPTDEGLPIEEALSGRTFRRSPALTWKYIHEVERACRGAKHNRGHEVIAELERRLERVWVLTQNVDGFHRAAGSRNVIEVHGDIHRLVCTACDWKDTVEDYGGLELPPKCPRCDAIVRPDVVLFGEMLPTSAVEAMRRELSRGFDLVVSVGTSAMFPYIAGPVVEAARAGLPTVEINPGETEISALFRHRLRSGAARALDAILAAFLGRP